MRMHNRMSTSDDHKATSIYDPNAIARSENDPDNATFHVVKGPAGDVEILWQGVAAEGTLLGSFVLTRANLEYHINKILSEIVTEHAKSCGIESRVTQMLDRRIEVAVKEYEKTAIQQAKVACHEAVLKRVRAAVEAANIRVEITTAPAPEAPANGNATLT